MDDPWSLSTLRVASNHRSSEDIAAVMRMPSDYSPRRAKRVNPPWTADVPTNRSGRLGEKLPDIERYLRDGADALESLADCDIDLRTTWGPLSPRDRIMLSSAFLGLLARLRCWFILDTSISKWTPDSPDDDGESDETWWRPTLRVDNAQYSAAQIEALVGQPSATPPDQPWSVEIPTEGVMRLVDSFPQVNAYLRERVDVLVSIPDGRITLAIDWLPRVPQDGITLDLDLLAVLDRLRCTVTLDTHIEE